MMTLLFFCRSSNKIMNCSGKVLFFVVVISAFVVSLLKKTTTSIATTPSAFAPPKEQYNVTRCKGPQAQTICAKSKPKFTKCWNGTSEKNVYCCNATAIGNKKPGRNHLFAPSKCCTADGQYKTPYPFPVTSITSLRLQLLLWHTLLLIRMYQTGKHSNKQFREMHQI